MRSVGWTDDITAYGATLDGATDDTAAFELAMACASSVYIPTGTCVLSNAGIVSGGTVRGDGIDLTVLKLLAGGDQYRAAITNSDYVGGNTNITIRDLTVDGNHANQTNDADGQNVYALLLKNVSGFAITNVKCIEAVNHCLYIHQSNNGTVTNCEGSYSSKDSGIEINGGGVAGASHDVSFIDCVAHNNFESGIEVDAGSQDITITNPTSYDNGMHGVEVEHHYVGLDLIAATSNVMINGGEVYQNGVEGIFCKGYYVTVNGIHSHHNTDNGIVCRQDGDNAVITNGEYNNNGHYGILIDGATGCSGSGFNSHDNTLGDVSGL